MLENFVETTKELLLNPVEKLKALRDEKLEDAFVYLIALIVILSVLSAVVTALIGGMALGINVLLFGLIGLIVEYIILTLIASVILHIFVYILGGRNGVGQTVKAVIYSFVPTAVLGWIPLLGIIGLIWSVVLQILAVRELQDMSTARAAIAVILLLVILLVVLVVIILMFFIVVVGTTYVATM